MFSFKRQNQIDHKNNNILNVEFEEVDRDMSCGSLVASAHFKNFSLLSGYNNFEI